MKYILTFACMVYSYSMFSQIKHDIHLGIGNGYHQNIFNHATAVKYGGTLVDRNDLWLSSHFIKPMLSYRMKKNGKVIDWTFHHQSQLQYFTGLKQPINSRVRNELQINHKLKFLRARWSFGMDLGHNETPEHYTDVMAPRFSRHIWQSSFEVRDRYDGGLYWRGKLMAKHNNYRSTITSLDHYDEYGAELYISQTFLEYIETNRLRLIAGWFHRDYSLSPGKGETIDEEIVIVDEDQATLSTRRRFNYLRGALQFVHGIAPAVKVTLTGRYEYRADVSGNRLGYQRVIPEIFLQHRSDRWSNHLKISHEWKMYADFKPYDSSEPLTYQYVRLSASVHHKISNKLKIGANSFYRMRTSNIDLLKKNLYRSYRTFYNELTLTLEL